MLKQSLAIVWWCQSTFPHDNSSMKLPTHPILPLTSCQFLSLHQQDKELVESLLDLKTQLDEILAVSFQKSSTFSDQLTNAFQAAVNSRSNKPAELVAKFIDAKLRGSKGVSEGELEATLDKALVVFGYIQVGECIPIV